MGIPIDNGTVTQVIPFKRGGTLGFTCVYTQDNPPAPADLTGVTVTSALESAAHIYYPMTVTVINPTTFIINYPLDTSNIATGSANMDICLSYGGVVFYTETWIVEIIDNVTQSPTLT